MNIKKIKESITPLVCILKFAIKNGPIYIFYVGVAVSLFASFIRPEKSENDLVVEQINDETEDGEISYIERVDIHGFGLDSIIATIVNKNKYDQEIKNKFVVLDPIQNKVFSKINDLLGLKSSYITKLSYRLLPENAIQEKFDMYPRIGYVIDIIHGEDASKEIIVKYSFDKPDYPSEPVYTAIFQYSYKNRAYRLIGTYPRFEVLDLSSTSTNEEGDVLERIISRQVRTEFSNLTVSTSSEGYLRCEDEEGNQFNLTMLDEYSDDFWMKGKYYGDILVLTHTRIDEEGRIVADVTCYSAEMTSADGEIIWNALFSSSFYVNKTNCRDEVINALKKNGDSTLELLD